MAFISKMRVSTPTRPTATIRSSRAARESVAARPVCVSHSDTERPGGKVQDAAKNIMTRISSGALALALSATLAATPPPAAEATALMRFQASDNPEVAKVQQTIIDAWNIVGQVYVDGDFNGHDWVLELSTAMTSSAKAEDPQAAYSVVGNMLSDLGDPYTRIEPPSEFEEFRMSTDGEVQGVGMLMASNNGRLLVVAPIKGGPADQAGIQPGDELLSVNGKSVSGLTSAEVAKVLRGKAGTSVAIRLHRRSPGIPGVASRPAQATPVIQNRQLRVKRAAVQLSNVYHEMLDDARYGKIGYININSFSQYVGRDTEMAIKELEDQGAKGYVLDLRDNSGGLVQAGMDVARIWLDGPANVFHVKGRPGSLEDSVQDINLGDGMALTHKPLAVLVNKNSASASEILAGALHDNGRATVIGNHSTFGKGKIQSVYELGDGSALFVTVAKYTTPKFQEIDQTGITPDLACGQPTVMEILNGKGTQTEDLAAILTAETEDDSCVQSAEEFLTRSAGPKSA